MNCALLGYHIARLRSRTGHSAVCILGCASSSCSSPAARNHAPLHCRADGGRHSCLRPPRFVVRVVCIVLPPQCGVQLDSQRGWRCLRVVLECFLQLQCLECLALLRCLGSMLTNLRERTRCSILLQVKPNDFPKKQYPRALNFATQLSKDNA